MSPMPKGFRHSAATLAKMSAAAKGNKRGLGYRHTNEARAKISATHMGNQYARKKKKTGGAS
jgi:NUMOD3 motif